MTEIEIWAAQDPWPNLKGNKQLEFAFYPNSTPIPDEKTLDFLRKKYPIKKKDGSFDLDCLNQSWIDREILRRKEKPFNFSTKKFDE